MENKTSKVLGFFKDVPGWAKGIIVIIIVLLLAWLVYKFYKNVKPPSDQQKDLETDKNDLLKQGQKPSYSRSQYQSFSDSLFEAMHGMGTDEDEIISVFGKMKNTLDVVLTIEAFGYRDYKDDSLLGYNVKSMNLNQWLSAELDTADKGKINTTLSAKGIKYLF